MQQLIDSSDSCISERHSVLPGEAGIFKHGLPVETTICIELLTSGFPHIPTSVQTVWLCFSVGEGWGKTQYCIHCNIFNIHSILKSLGLQAALSSLHRDSRWFIVPLKDFSICSWKKLAKRPMTQ